MTLRSMTGFGSGATPGMIAEIKVVNHRFVEVRARLPRELSALEPLAVELIRSRVHRGSVELLVKTQPGSRAAPRPRVNVDLARAVAAELDGLRHTIGIEEPVGLGHLLAIDGIVDYTDSGAGPEQLWQELRPALESALDHVDAMRAAEGQKTAAFLETRLEAITGLREAIAQIHAGLVPRTFDALKQRLAALAADTAVDPARLAQEAAMLADKGDISEELERLASHTGQFRKYLGGGGPNGRKLDFLVQEMNREINTIGSKSQDVAIAHHVVELKTELERMREQIQNLE